MSLQNTSNAPEIEVENLVIRYGPVAAVGPVSFAVKQGEQLTLLGPSGCGKTTTLRSIAGLERPSGGSIRIRGETVYDEARGSTFLRNGAACRWCSSPMRSGRT